MGYIDQLGDERWKSLSRLHKKIDGNVCQRCGKWWGEMHLHHKFYLPANKAWEYSKYCLITLCKNCHEKVHEIKTGSQKSNTIPIDFKKKLDFSETEKLIIFLALHSNWIMNQARFVRAKWFTDGTNRKIWECLVCSFGDIQTFIKYLDWNSLERVRLILSSKPTPKFLIPQFYGAVTRLRNSHIDHLKYKSSGRINDSPLRERRLRRRRERLWYLQSHDFILGTPLFPRMSNELIGRVNSYLLR